MSTTNRKSTTNGTVNIVLAPKPEPPPDSWWMGARPDGFTKRAEKEIPRMRGSREHVFVSQRIVGPS